MLFARFGFQAPQFGLGKLAVLVLGETHYPFAELAPYH